MLWRRTQWKSNDCIKVGDMKRKTPPEAIDQILAEAFAIEAESAQRAGALGFMARALVQATLPHRRVEGNEFVRQNGNFTLSLMAPSHIGLPFGSIPRLLLAWLTTEAVRTQSRELLLGPSLSSFMQALDMVPTGGRWGSITRLKAQTVRLFASTITASYEDASKTTLAGLRIADRAVLWWDAKAPEQTALWRSSVTLTEAFYREVIARPVPIDLRALKCLKKSPLALDLYVWLTYRFSYLDRPTEIPWAALAAQFGSDYGRLRGFKEALLHELRKVLTVYPEAQVEPGEEGLILKLSRPHIAK